MNSLTNLMIVNNRLQMTDNLKPFTTIVACFRCIGFIAFILLSSTAFACEENEQCIETDQWSLGLAIGVGAKTNPLVDGDTIPQVLLFDIAWYGESTYFDNGELGFRWQQEENFGVETYLTLDRERAFFHFWDPANIFVNTGVSSAPEDEFTLVSIDSIERRKWTVLAGSRVNYYQGSQKWSLSLESDLLGVHNGQRFGISYQKAWVGENWRVLLKSSLIWKSDNVIDYYYGLKESDKAVVQYQGKGGVQPGVSLIYAYDITPNWQFIFSSSYQALHSGMTKSPLVKDKHVSSLFIGAGYRF